MTDTSIKYALELSIQEFNTWSESKNDYQKYSIQELKGVFFNKLVKNLQGTSAFEFIQRYQIKSHLSTNLISQFEVQNSKISALKFIEQSPLVTMKEILIILNKTIGVISLGNINVLPNFADNILAFRI